MMTMTPLSLVPLDDLLEEVKRRCYSFVILAQLADEDPRTIATFGGHPYTVIGMMQSYLSFHLRRDTALWEENDGDLLGG